jgi:hypothetical protein
MIFFCFYPVLATTDKRIMHWNNNGHAKKQQHWNNKKKHTSLMIVDRSHNKNEELGYLCVCVCSRGCSYQMHERNATKRKKTAEKNLQEQYVRKKKKKKKNI